MAASFAKFGPMLQQMAAGMTPDAAAECKVSNHQLHEITDKSSKMIVEYITNNTIKGVPFSDKIAELVEHKMSNVFNDANLEFNDRLVALFLNSMKENISKISGNTMMLYSIAFNTKQGHYAFRQLLLELFTNAVSEIGNNKDASDKLSKFKETIFSTLNDPNSFIYQTPKPLSSSNQSGGQKYTRHTTRNNRPKKRQTEKKIKGGKSSGSKFGSIKSLSSAATGVYNQALSSTRKIFKSPKPPVVGSVNVNTDTKKKNGFLKRTAKVVLGPQYNQIKEHYKSAKRDYEESMIPSDVSSYSPQNTQQSSINRSSTNADPLDPSVILQKNAEQIINYLENHMNEMNQQLIDNMINAMHESIKTHNSKIIQLYTNNVNQIMNRQIPNFDNLTTRLLLANILKNEKQPLIDSIGLVYHDILKQATDKGKIEVPFSSPNFLDQVMTKLQENLIKKMNDTTPAI